MLISRHLRSYAEAIRELPEGIEWTRESLLTDSFLMERHGELAMYYAPHNEYANPSARIVLVGLTPGWTQMRIAIREARGALAEGLGDEAVCRRAKEAARFAGTMRAHLIAMLDELGLHRHLGLRSSGALFRERDGLPFLRGVSEAGLAAIPVERSSDGLGEGSAEGMMVGSADGPHLMHSTSALRFPVFARGRNYGGSRPGLLASPFLREAALGSLRDELGMLEAALVIPLGRTVEQALRILAEEGSVDDARCLWGFPHPSGANGHRRKQFDAQRDRMERKLASIRWG
ncbi:hypothetical protein [Cohnella fermenti]|uniref:Uracil-DNA glycosylase-like domain-containing protein n=1 Tax=Cohnella fermenti TaxID=2565925 RepID=A0A4S4C8W0_9BACL|nr:hypothetical protein [Cohnella fermenti]THF82211.1 hypothetical protein E6C55_07460 [Cohnella fermenti]